MRRQSGASAGDRPRERREEWTERRHDHRVRVRRHRNLSRRYSELTVLIARFLEGEDLVALEPALSSCGIHHLEPIVLPVRDN